MEGASSFLAPSRLFVRTHACPAERFEIVFLSRTHFTCQPGQRQMPDESKWATLSIFLGGGSLIRKQTTHSRTVVRSHRDFGNLLGKP